MRRVWASVLVLMLGACGAESSPATSEAADSGTPPSSPPVTITTTEPTLPPTTATVSTGAPTTAAPETTITGSPTTTLAAPDHRWAVAAFGVNPTEALGSAGDAGSGCAPGSDVLPDGVWFGWLDAVGPSSLDFDLACLRPGRIEAVVANNSRRLRVVAVAEGALVYPGTSGPVTYDAWRSGGSAEAREAGNAPGLEPTSPYWLFVNDGVVTEMARHREAIGWREGRAADWPPVTPGCCDGGTVAPPSSPGPLPDTGWPADGIYATHLVALTFDHVDLVVGRWARCRDHPGECPEWWTGDEVFVEGDMVDRRVPLDRSVRTVVRPIGTGAPIIGTGIAFADLRRAMDASANRYGVDDGGGDWARIVERSSDPRFPYEVTDDGAVAFRGPGGVKLTTWEWWYVLEIRDGKPILYADAGIVAG